jgi:uncharacterized protein with HEPN domain
MPREHSDESYLWDMLEHARGVSDFVAGRTYENYVNDKLFRAAVERYIEIIGEAARNVSQVFQDSHREIPWRKIVAQRHVLSHEYGEIKHDRIWRVATIYVPELIEQLKPLVPTPPSDPAT